MKEQRDESYGHVLKYTSLFGGVPGLVILISLVRNKAMALLLGAGGMGLNALLMSMQKFASQCTNLGISFGAVPKLSELHEQQADEQLRYNIQIIRLWSLIAAVLGFLFCIVASPLMNEVSFTWGDHTLHYAMLAISVAMMAVTGGETAIMKATRQLGKLARTQIYTVIATLIVSVPLYYFYGHSGVVPAIVLIAFATMLITIAYSYRTFPFRFDFRRSMLREGAGMIRLGLAFVFAAAVGSASEMAIRAYLNVVGSLDEVGLYNAAFMITITYAGMVFSAMESDFFPRLSGVASDIEATNNTVNIVAIVMGYRLWGIWGTGVAIVIAHVAENFFVTGYATWKFDYRTTSSVMRYAAIQMTIGFAAYAVTLLTDGWLYWITEAALTIVSTAYSVHILRQKTHLWERLRSKLRI